MKPIRWFLLLAVAGLLAAGAAPPSKPSPLKGGKVAAAETLLDINTATPEQLAALPGIGKVYAEKIVKGRPYRAKNELADKNVIPPAVYDKIKDKIIARQK